MPESGFHGRRVFVFTVTSDKTIENYRNTLQQPVPWDLIQQYAPSLVDVLKDRLTKNEVFMWGARPIPKNKFIWRKMRVGDYVMAYRVRELIDLFRIVGKLHNPEFAERLWGKGTFVGPLSSMVLAPVDMTWEYMYFLDRVASISVPSPRFFQTLTGPIDNAEDLWNALPPAVQKEIVAREEELEVPETEIMSEIEQRIQKGNYRAEDSWGPIRRRISQNIFRKYVLENFNNSCCVCGLNAPEALEASHIRSREENPDNWLNPRNGLCLCANHHKAFEKGILRIEAPGIIRCDISKVSEENEATRNFMLAYDGAKIMEPTRYKPLLFP